MDITVMFAMAGEGRRFGYAFKPLLRIGEETFIERAVKSFDRRMEDVKEVLFVYLRTQDQAENASERLHGLFPSLPYRVILLDAPTKGPAETIRKALEKDGSAERRLIVCDCDHFLDAEPLFQKISSTDADCVLSLWDLKAENIASWGVAAVDNDGAVRGIAEKVPPQEYGQYFGVIGCTYFKGIASILSNEHVYLSEIIADEIVSGRRVLGARITTAEFFGDPVRLANALAGREIMPGRG